MQQSQTAQGSTCTRTLLRPHHIAKLPSSKTMTFALAGASLIYETITLLVPAFASVSLDFGGDFHVHPVVVFIPDLG
jgi:hypothetical protein